MRNDYKIRPRSEFKAGGKVKKSGKGFPDLTGDGKVTFKDILKGRGVIKKKGGMVKKGMHKMSGGKMMKDSDMKKGKK